MRRPSALDPDGVSERETESPYQAPETVTTRQRPSATLDRSKTVPHNLGGWDMLEGVQTDRENYLSVDHTTVDVSAVTAIGAATATSTAKGSFSTYILPTVSTLIVLYLAVVYGFFAMLRAKSLTENPALLITLQTWFFGSSFDFNLAPNTEFIKNHFALLKTVWDGSKGWMFRLVGLPALAWALLATLPGTAASYDALDGVSKNALFVGIGTAIFSLAFLVTRINGAHGFLWNKLYFTIALHAKLMMPQYSPYKQLRDDLKVMKTRSPTLKFVGDEIVFANNFYESMRLSSASLNRTWGELTQYLLEDWIMGELVPIVGAIGVFPTFKNMASAGFKVSENLPFLNKMLSPIAGEAVYVIGAAASAVFYYRTSSGFYDTMKRVLIKLADIMSDSTSRAKAAYSALFVLLAAQAYTSGGGVADEKLKVEYAKWLRWFNSWVVMGEAGVLVNGKAYGDFFLKICSKMDAPGVSLPKALLNYFFGAYDSEMPIPSGELTIQGMLDKLEHAIVVHGVDEQGNLKLKADGSSLLLGTDILTNRERRRMGIFQPAATATTPLIDDRKTSSINYTGRQ